MTGEYAKSFNKFRPKKVEVNEATVEEAIKFGQYLKRSEEDIAEAIDICIRVWGMTRSMDQKKSQQLNPKNNRTNDYPASMTRTHITSLYKLQHLGKYDCFTIALGKRTGTTFPITFNNNQNYNALYDTGAGASLINYSAYVSLGKDLNTGYQPYVKNTSEEDMAALGQVTCTFTINNQPFTQSFIICRHMT